MIVPYGIPSQKNKAKEGLTLRLKLEQSEIISLIHFEPTAVVQKVVQDTCNIIIDKMKI